MNKLEEARKMIEQVDQEMIELFLKRMQASKMVAEFKKKNQLPILDQKREAELIQKNLKHIPLNLQEYYRTFFEGVLRSSKAYQEDLNQ